jgi:pyruvate ferredoxin oxidoreductase alpha subunit
MHEVLHWVCGARLPIVLANVNRAVGAGWNIWADQTDSISQRDTGWIQIYCESNQEVLDGIIMAYKVAESLLLPVMITYDAFFLSHTSEVVDIPEQEKVDEFLPPYRPPYMIDVENPRMLGGMIGPDLYYEERYLIYRDFQKTINVYRETCEEFKRIFGREYELAEEVLTHDADVIIVTAGTISSVSRIVVEELRNKGIKAGLMKIRMFRPAPIRLWQESLSGAKKVIVIDRNLIGGLGGVFCSEIRSAMYGMQNPPLIYSAIAGLGGRDVTPDDVEGIVEYFLAETRPPEVPLFWGLKE